MIVYRLARQPFAEDLSGVGAAKVGGRCNRPGVRAVYTAENISLAVLEVLVHLDKHDLPMDYVLLAIEVPSTVPIHESDWRAAFADSDRRRHPVIATPSVIVPRERNFVLYPDVLDFSARVLWMERFAFDERLFAGGAPLQ